MWFRPEGAACKIEIEKQESFALAKMIGLKLCGRRHAKPIIFMIIHKEPFIFYRSSADTELN